MLLGRYAATFLAYSWDQSLRLGFAIYGVFDFTSTYCFHGKKPSRLLGRCLHVAGIVDTHVATVKSCRTKEFYAMQAGL